MNLPTYRQLSDLLAPAFRSIGAARGFALIAVAILPSTSWGQMFANGFSSSTARVQLAGEGEGLIYDNFSQLGSTSYSGNATDNEGSSKVVSASTGLGSTVSSSVISLRNTVHASQNSFDEEVLAFAKISVTGTLSLLQDAYVTLSISATVDGNNTSNAAIYVRLLRDQVLVAELSSAQSTVATQDVLLEGFVSYSYELGMVADKSFTQSGTGTYGMSVNNGTASITAVPEPNTCALGGLALLILGGAALGELRKRRSAFLHGHS